MHAHRVHGGNGRSGNRRSHVFGRIGLLPGDRLSLRQLSGLSAPTLADFNRLAAQAWAQLPNEFRALCADLVIRVEDFPQPDVLRAMNAKSPFDLLGLFHGVGLAHAEAVTPTGRMPNMIFLYRRPILDYWAEHDETLGAIVTHVLIHEIGHHFGLSDDDIDRIEAGS
jgi:predicted Zn-dependent protease with MMP-like domain